MTKATEERKREVTAEWDVECSQYEEENWVDGRAFSMKNSDGSEEIQKRGEI